MKIPEYNERMSEEVNRPGSKAQYNCLKIKNASGPGQSTSKGEGGGGGGGGGRSPEAEAFLSQVTPKTLSPSTFFYRYIHFY